MLLAVFGQRLVDQLTRRDNPQPAGKRLLNLRPDRSYMAPTPKVYASEIAELAGILDAHIVTVHDLARRVTEKGLERSFQPSNRFWS